MELLKLFAELGIFSMSSNTDNLYHCFLYFGNKNNILFDSVYQVFLGRK